MTHQQTFKSIVKQLNTAGLEAVVRYANGVVIIAAEDDSQAKEILNMDRFSGYINEVEVVIV